MSSPLEWRRAAAREIARSAGQLERLRGYRHDLTLSLNRLRVLSGELPDSSALEWAESDLKCVLTHLEHAITSLEARSR